LRSTPARRAPHIPSDRPARRGRARLAACVFAALLASATIVACDSGSGSASAANGKSDRRSRAPGGAISVVDDAGQTVRLARPAQRIVSLIPSATETAVAIGAGGQLVGRTDFDHGPAVDGLPSVGGGMDPSIEALVALKPDLVLTWETKQDRRVRDRMAELGIPAFAVKAEDTTDVFRTLHSVGALTGRGRTADSLAAALRAELAAVRASVAGRPAPRVFFLVWNDPPMTAGPHTFISQILGVAGGANTFADAGADWPNVSMEEILRRDPDVLVLPQGEKGGAHDIDQLRAAPGWRELRAMRQGRTVAVPADLVNRPGPRLAEAARLLRDRLHPAAARP
jgi:iron complex transport system substrate-binding protein